MKNVLFIVYYFPPMGGSGVQRPLKFIKYMREFGWNPIVLCPEPGMYPYFDESLQQELESISPEIIRIQPKTLLHSAGRVSKQNQIPDFAAKIFRRIMRLFMFPDNKKGWIKPAVEEGLAILEEKHIDLIFSTAPPFSNHIIGSNLKRFCNTPLVLDYRDAWLNNHYFSDMLTWQKKKMYKMEKECLAHTDAVICLDEETLNDMHHNYPGIKSSYTLPHGFDHEDFEVSEAPCLDYKKSKFNFLYSGIFYENNQPDAFLKAIKIAIKEEFIPKEKIHLHFQGGLDSRILKLIHELKLQEIVTDYGYLSHKQAVANLKKADVLWMISNFDASLKQVKSGKLFEYFGARKPILGLMHQGEESKLLKEYGAGYVANVSSVVEIAKEIKEVFNVWEQGANFSVNDSFVEKFNRKKLTEKLVNIFNEISAQ